MIAQIQGLKYFVANQLSDVVDWPKHVRVDEKKTTGDHAFVDIATPFNRYKMAICSSYIEPPPGAPLACKSLGTVTFDDAAGNKHIVGPKADLTWTDISKHIHMRELTDALAAARRELAEGTGTNAKLAEVAERAKKWGVAAKVPEGLTSPVETRHDPVNAPAMVAAAISNEPAALIPVHSTGLATPASRDAPWLGAPIFFITNPGEQIGGMGEIVGWCVKVYSHDRISIFMTPDHSEPSYRDNLPRRGSPAGNGRMHQFNCWDFNPEALRQASRIRHLEEAIEKMAEEGNRDREEMAQLAARLAALDDPLGPPKRRGRPPKTVTEPGTEPDASMPPEGFASATEKPEGSEAA